jgi:hypothetical protein
MVCAVDIDKQALATTHCENLILLSRNLFEYKFKKFQVSTVFRELLGTDCVFCARNSPKYAGRRAYGQLDGV